MGRLIVCFALLASPAAACINDDELPTHEREFRSQYHELARPSTAPANPFGSGLLLGTGAALLTGAAAVALFGGRSRN